MAMLRVGLAMLQGARHEHAEALRGAANELGLPLEIVQCRRSDDIDGTLDALVLPGGESTTMRIASQHESLLSALFSWMEAHPNRPVLGTCAGAILLAEPGDQRSPFIAASISRNAWGRQRDSFEAVVSVSLQAPQAVHQHGYEPAQRDRFAHQPLEVASQGAAAVVDGFPGVFIRAPRFNPNGLEATPIATLGEEVVGVLDGSRLGVTFHPELTLDRRFHRWLLTAATLNKEAE
jgi:5'-phosphate synthase pdxT subunit